MLSIIVCSRNNKINNLFADNISKTIGVDYELICIDNSRNEYSIYSAYNAGIQKCIYPYLCFVHEDVFFHTQCWGEKVIAHLNVPNTGFVGLAGGDAALRIPSDYGALNRCMNIIHVDKRGIEPTEYVLFPRNYTKPSRSVVMLDGVLLCAKRELFSEICFDETLGKFHGYDYDISIQSNIAGYYNYVMYDISVEHYSKGNMDATYYQTMIKVFQKWESHLPIFEHSISIDEQNRLLPVLEKQILNKLLKKLVRAKFNRSIIIEIYSYYTKITGSKIDITLLKVIRLRIFFIWITSVLRKKIK